MNNINLNIPPEPRGEQTTPMGLDHDKALAQFYKEAFATALVATKALITQVKSFDETSALACEKIVVARKEHDDSILLWSIPA